MKAKAKRHLEMVRRHGADLHACPECGRLLECDGVGPGRRHWIRCPEHGVQVGVGAWYVPREEGVPS